MGRNPIKENQNPYFRARKQAAEWDARMESRERASELGSKALYCALAGFCNKERMCFPSIDTLMRATGMTRNTLYKHMRTLEQKGIVKKAYMKNGPENFDRRLVYRLCDFQNREPGKAPPNT